MGCITETLRKAAIDSGKSILCLSRESGLHYNSIHGFYKGTKTMTLESADKLAAVLGLELKPIKKRKGA